MGFVAFTELIALWIRVPTESDGLDYYNSCPDDVSDWPARGTPSDYVSASESRSGRVNTTRVFSLPNVVVRWFDSQTLPECWVELGTFATL